MNRSRVIVLLGLAASLNAQFAFAQGTFQNLDFESGQFNPIPGDPYGRVEWQPAMPGWTGYLGNSLQSVVSLNNLSLGSANISIYGPDYPSPNLFHGQYFVVLQAGDFAFPGDLVPASIAQSGTIPLDARSIRFYARGFPQVSFDGQTLSLSRLGGTLNTYFLYGADVTSLAGQLRELRFVATPNSSVFLDFIQFSTVPIPEPGSLALVTLGAAWLAWSFRRRRA